MITFVDTLCSPHDQPLTFFIEAEIENVEAGSALSALSARPSVLLMPRVSVHRDLESRRLLFWQRQPTLPLRELLFVLHVNSR